MGVRIDAHAVDVVAMRRVLERPLWRILLEALAEHADAAPDDVLFSVFDPTTGERYHVMGRRGILRSRLAQGWKPQPVDEERLRREPFLQQSMTRYLAGPLSSTLSLKSLLRELTHVDGHRFAVPITSGYRRWWMPSAIEAARRDNLLPASETEQLAEYLGRIRRGYRAEGVLPFHPDTPPTYDVPGIGSNEDDTKFAVFEEGECRRMGALTARLAACETRFDVPQVWADDDPQTMVVWQGHVRARLAEFAQLRDLELPNLRLITFIG